MVMVLGKDLEAALASVGLSLVTRAEWGARAPDYRNGLATPTPKFYDHHAAIESTDDAREVRAHQAYHMDHNGWADIAYHFLIPDPNPGNVVFEGRGVGVQGGATQGENSESHALCVMGNFQVDKPSPATLEVAAKLMALGIRKRWWSNKILGHRDAPGASTSCPGQYWYAQLPWLRARVNQILSGSVPPPTPTPTPPSTTPGGYVDVPLPVLKRGNRGGSVKSLQSLLRTKAGQNIAVDGIFGPGTETAVKNVQRFFRLTADGIVGRRTWPCLFL